MLHIKNLINSPYEIVNADGERVMLPAGGEIDVDVHPMHLPTISVLGYFQITEIGKGKSDPLDHDGDGKKGGSLPADASDAEILRLRAEYTELTGKKPHHLWKAERLQAEIDAALAS